jgi:uncharacterized integral membrane protein
MARAQSSISIAPITEKDLAQIRDREKELAAQYFKQAPDFLKWTSTVAVAAVLWIGNSIDSVSGAAWVASIACLLLLICSLILAVFAIKRILAARTRQWDVVRENYTLYLIKQWKSLKQAGVHLGETSTLDDVRKEEEEQIERLLKAVDSVRAYSEPKGFSMRVSLHMVLLIAGLIVYVLAQVLSTL